jgi:hypothetical protein
MAARAYPPPVYRQIVEPFAGSAGYSLRYPDRDVLLVELRPVVAQLWRWLIAAEPDEVLQLPDVPEGVTVHELGLTGAARALVGYWLNPGQVTPAARRSRFRTAEFRFKGWGETIRRRIARYVTGRSRRASTTRRSLQVLRRGSLTPCTRDGQDWPTARQRSIMSRSGTGLQAFRAR